MGVSADGLALSVESATDSRAVEPGERGPTINTLDHAAQPFSSQSDGLAGTPQLFLFCAAGSDASEALAALRIYKEDPRLRERIAELVREAGRPSLRAAFEREFR